MLTISRAISAGQALDYYKQEFTNSKDNYYSESGAVKGRWCGTLAEEWNLKGGIQRAIRALSCRSRSAYWRATYSHSVGPRGS